MPKKKSEKTKSREISLFFLRGRKAGPQTRKKKGSQKFTIKDEMSKY